ncbi:MAG: hypothetical protein ABI037_09340 [Gemmatimonadales bacterium]
MQKPTWVKILALAGLIAALLVLGRYAGGVLPEVADRVSRMGAWGPVAYVVVYAVGAVLLTSPGRC